MFRLGNYNEAEQRMRAALNVLFARQKRVKRTIFGPSWEPAFNNLAHVLRKLKLYKGASTLVLHLYC